MHLINVQVQLLSLLILSLPQRVLLLHNIFLALFEGVNLLLVPLLARLKLGLQLSQLLVSRLVLPGHVSHDGIGAFLGGLLRLSQLLLSI